jgi:hypothetical protein
MTGWLRTPRREVNAAAGLLWAVGIMVLGVWGLGALVGWSNDRTRLARDTAEAARRADHRTVAYDEVGGECAKDHARTGGWYAARLTHWVKVSTGETSVSAYVRRPDADVLRAALERWDDPHRYRPPDSIDVPHLSPDALGEAPLTRRGVSVEGDRWRYAATCVFRIVLRADSDPREGAERMALEAVLAEEQRRPR